MMALRIQIAWIIAVWCAGCSTEPRTQVIAIIDAEPGVRSQARTLRVLVYGGEQMGDAVPTERSLDRPYPVSMTTGWPVLVALAPKDKDSGRIYRVVATAHSETNPSDNNAIAEVRVISGYVKDRTLSISLLFQDSCVGQFGCATSETCKNGTCQTATVDKTSLPEYHTHSTNDGGVRQDSGNIQVDSGLTCQRDTDCPTLAPTNCTECVEPSGGPCGMSGTQSCTVPVGRCESNQCTTRDMTQTLSCNRTTDGDVCAQPLYDAWGTCKPASSDPCDVNGQQQRNVTEYACLSGGCRFSDRVEYQVCPLNTEGLPCGFSNLGWCGQGACVETYCSNGYDDDLDGLCDYGLCPPPQPNLADGDCSCFSGGLYHNCFETSCYNGQDDDQDGLYDCYDDDCWYNSRPCGYTPGYYCTNVSGNITCSSR